MPTNLSREPMLCCLVKPVMTSLTRVPLEKSEVLSLTPIIDDWFNPDIV
jgi:hypothetical protein